MLKRPIIDHNLETIILRFFNELFFYFHSWLKRSRSFNRAADMNWLPRLKQKKDIPHDHSWIE